MRTLLRFASFASLFVLLTPTNVKGIAVLLAGFAVVGLMLQKGKLFPKTFIQRELLFYDIVFAAFLPTIISSRWINSSKIEYIAGTFGFEPSVFLTAAAVLTGVLSIFAIDDILSILRELKQRINQKANKSVYHVFQSFVIVGIALIEYSQLIFSTEIWRDSSTFWGGYLPKNVSFVLIINLVIVLIFRRWKPALAASGVFFTLWSVANYYVIQFHGSPLFVSEFVNAGTALDALKGYKLPITPVVLGCIELFILQIFLIRYVLEDETGEKPSGKVWLIRIAVMLACIAFLFGTYNYGKSMIAFDWYSGIRENGFSLCVIDDVVHMIHKYNEPEGYDSSLIRETEVDKTSYSDVRPDIILILNETFCDLDYYSDVSADRDYLGQFYETENAVFGHSVVPSVGGGTNNSEFELLTSKSMKLLTTSAPFNYVDFTASQPSSIVQYAKSLGYTTTALHWCGTCYSRHEAFPAMGFDRIVMGEDKLTNELNGSRIVNDAGTYRDLIEYYEEGKGEPQLFYLLTYQNHGGYEQNPPELDTVHMTRDFGDLTDDVDEYLSSLALSAEAFRELTEYFSSSDRPVIVCMVGDHGPSLISQLPANRKMSEEEKTIAMRTVPYAIWTNYGAELSDCPEYVTMTDLVPTVLKVAGLPLSPFYQSILDLNQLVPIRTSTGMLVTADGGIAPFDPAHPYYDAVRQYLFMEYNALKGGDDYREELFAPTIG